MAISLNVILIVLNFLWKNFLIWALAISLVLLLGPALGTNISASVFGSQSGSSPPISRSHTSCKGCSTTYPFPCFSFNPHTFLSFPVTFPITCASFHSARSFASPFSITTTLVFGTFCSVLPVECCCLSSRTWTYYFMNLFWSCSLLLCKKIICLVTLSSSIFLRSSSTGVDLPLSKVFGLALVAQTSPLGRAVACYSSLFNNPARPLLAPDRLVLASANHFWQTSLHDTNKALKEASPLHHGALAKLNVHFMFSIPM